MADDYSIIITICSRIIQVLIAALVSVCAWNHREEVSLLLKQTRSRILGPATGATHVSEKQAKFERRVAEEFEKWKCDMKLRCVQSFLPVMSIFLISVAIRLYEPDATFLFIAIVIGSLYVLCMLLVRGTIPASPRIFDAVFLLLLLVYSSRIVVQVFSPSQAFATFSFRRFGPLFRATVSVVHLNYRVAFVSNLFVSCLDIILDAAVLGFSGTPLRIEASSELFAFVIIVLLAYFAEQTARSLVSLRLESNASAGGRRAVHAILSVLCDAVVQLGRDLAILDECPQLSHLLMSGVGAMHKLEGANFMRYVIDEDKEMFQKFISRQAEHANIEQVLNDRAATSTAALRISLKDAMGSIFRVEVIHTHLPSVDEDGHLLGIRDLGDHGREVILQNDSPQIDVVGPLLEVQRSHASSTSSSASGSTTSVENKDSFALKKLHSLSLVLDAFAQGLPVVEAVVRFQGSDDEESSVDEHDRERPALSGWMSSRRFCAFDDWIQNATNALAYGNSAPSFGEVTLKPSSVLSLSARRAYAHATESDTLRVSFEDVNLRLPKAHRKGRRGLSCTQARPQAIWSPSVTRTPEDTRDQHDKSSFAQPCLSL